VCPRDVMEELPLRATSFEGWNRRDVGRPSGERARFWRRGWQGLLHRHGCNVLLRAEPVLHHRERLFEPFPCDPRARDAHRRVKRRDPCDVVVEQGQQFIRDHHLKGASRHRWRTLPKHHRIATIPFIASPNGWVSGSVSE